MAVTYKGTSITAAGVLKPGKTRTINGEKDQVKFVYTCHKDSADSLLPAYGSTIASYPLHYLVEEGYTVEDGDQATMVLIYETPQVAAISIPAITLPPAETEYAFSTQDRFIGDHPAYTSAWLGNPKSLSVLGATKSYIDDPRGNPTTTPSKKSEAYLFPALIYRAINYTFTQPTVGTASAAAVGTRNIPPGEAGTNRWLKTAFGASRRKDQAYWKITEEWTYSTTGTWDTDLYA